MKIKPIFDRVVIEPEEQVAQAKFGIVLPESSQERSQFGKVVAVGDGESVDCDKTKMKLKVGDKVIYSKFAGAEVKLDGKNYIIMRQIDVIGVIE